VGIQSIIFNQKEMKFMGLIFLKNQIMELFTININKKIRVVLMFLKKMNLITASMQPVMAM